MSELAPADVAVVLRSIGRRVGEAERTAEGEAPPPEMLAELDATVRLIAQQAGTPTTGDRDTMAAAAADRIEHVPASQWTEESLDRVRAAARTIGSTLRTLQTWAEAAAQGR